MVQGNFKVDFVYLFANIIDGEFSKGVHRNSFDPGGSCYFCPDYPVSFCLKSFLSVYR